MRKKRFNTGVMGQYVILEAIAVKINYNCVILQDIRNHFYAKNLAFHRITFYP